MLEHLKVAEELFKAIDKARKEKEMIRLQRYMFQLSSTSEELLLADASADNQELEKRRLETLGKAQGLKTIIDELLDIWMINAPSKKDSVKTIEKLHVPQNVTFVAQKIFKDDPAEWPAFWEYVQDHILDDQHRSPQNKVACICMCLDDKVKRTIGNIALTGNNLQLICDTLKVRYDNPQKLLNRYMTTLDEIPRVSSTHLLRETIDQLKALWRNLEMLSARISVDAYAVRCKIVSKFSDEVLRWVFYYLSVEFKDLNYTPKNLLDALDKHLLIEEHIHECKARERVNMEPLHVLVHTTSKEDHKGKRKTSRARSPSPKRKTFFCWFCQKDNHAPTECTKYPTPAVRYERLRQLERCIKCAGRKHFARDCRRPEPTCGSCKKQGHLTALCRPTTTRSKTPTKKVTFGESKYNVFLQTFTCKIFSQRGGAQEVRGLFDNGSDRSFILENIIKNLGIEAYKKQKVVCSRFMQEEARSIEIGEVMLSVQNRFGTNRTYRFYVTPCIAGNLITAPSPEVFEGKLPPHLQYADQDLFFQERRPIEILIGSDIYHELVNITISKRVSSGFFLINSFFGWVPSGNLPGNKALRHATALLITNKAWDMTGPMGETSWLGPVTNTDGCSTQESSRCGTSSGASRAKVLARNEVENLWSLEMLGIENPEVHINEERALEHFQKTMFRGKDGRYVVRLPWKDTKTPLPTNYRMAMARLKSILERTPEDKLVEIDKVLQEQLKEGIIEVAPFPKREEQRINKLQEDEVKRVHYLPHRWVQERTKIRIVYDASAKTKTGFCLNDLVHKGMNLTKVMIGLLLNFRIQKVVLTADIQGAYLQIELNELDRDATRFLWIKDVKDPKTNQQNLRYLRFARVPFGINASPFLLNMVLQQHFSEDVNNEWARIGQEKFYVDNLVLSVPTSLAAVQVYEYMNERLNEIKMNLRDWATNDDMVFRAIPKEKREKSGEDMIKVLGIMWNKKTDTISCKMNDNLPMEGTKRNVLKFLASIYDPLNLFSPCLLDMKIFLRKCWKNKYEWNQALPQALQAEWIKLRTETLEIPKINLPRKYWNCEGEGTYALHIFCDASKDAYACCAYLVFTTKRKNESKASLIFSKMRLSPPKALSIPRLELMGVIIGKRTAEFLRGILDVSLERVVIWTDATTVLHWLQSVEILQPFVQNRIKELRKAQNIEYRYVMGSENPADYATRGKPARILKDLENWWNGPSWLLHSALWPQPPDNVYAYDSRTKSMSITSCAIGKATTSSIITDRLEKNFSTWNSRIRVFRNILKWKSNIYGLTTEVELLKSAEIMLIKELQKKYYAQERKLLEKKIRPPSNLDLYLDEDGLIRCGGRLQHAKLELDAIHPILMPRESLVTESYIRKLHIENGHVGVSHVLAKLRERFWIVKGRAKVKSIIHRCVICRRWEGKGYKLPPIPPLPAARVIENTPFLQVGIDYFGPLPIRALQDTNVFVLIFACLVTRAIHLELVPNQSGEHCMLALSRFASLRRVPQLIISDNSTTFHFLQPLVGVKVKITDHQVQKFTENNRIEWYFIPQYAPWYGGAYERLIGIVKRCLKKSYGNCLLTYEQLRTVLYRIMDIVNDRPLTYIPSDELVKPLTPNQFLRLGPANVNTSFEINPKPPRTATGTEVITMWRQVERIMNNYWEMFRHQYLTSLRERHLVENKSKKGEKAYIPSVGDVVIVEEPNTPRGAWRMGVITQVDVRQALALVKTQKGTLYRSIRQLYPLELKNTTPVPKAVPYPRLPRKSQ